MTDKPLKCPFCGEPPLGIGYDGQPAEPDSFHWRCICGATGPRTSGNKVTTAWNTRTPDPAREALREYLATSVAFFNSTHAFGPERVRFIAAQANADRVLAEGHK